MTFDASCRLDAGVFVMQQHLATYPYPGARGGLHRAREKRFLCPLIAIPNKVPNLITVTGTEPHAFAAGHHKM